jgi:hypothetical protein
VSGTTYAWSVVRAFVGGVLLPVAYQSNAATNGTYTWHFITVPPNLVSGEWSTWTVARVNDTHFGASLSVSTTGASTAQLRLSELRVLVYGTPTNKYLGPR